MRIAIVTIGSRGDVQPYVALGMGLQAAGFGVRLAAHEEFEPFVRSHGLEFASVSGNPREAMTTENGKQWLESQSNPIKFLRGMKRLAEPTMWQTARDMMQATEDADLILASTLALFSAQSIGERLGVPVIAASPQPIITTRHFVSPAFPLPPAWLPFPQIYNRLSHPMARKMMWTVFGDSINKIRADMLDLPPTRERAWTLHGDLLALLGYSEHVVPKPPDWGQSVHVTGYWFLDSARDYRPPAALAAFLDAGAPPVYVGFGSMANRNPEAIRTLVLQALERSGQRGILLTGWGGMSRANLPDTVLQVDSIPHDWLFPRMAAVVHHGGAVTTAAGLRAGVPSIVIPFFADQPFWAERVYRLGVGPKPIPRSRLTAGGLADAIRAAVSDREMQRRATSLGEKLRAEDGVARAVEAIQREVERGNIRVAERA